jgi:hypothetical protein
MDNKCIFTLAIIKAMHNGWSHFVGEDEAHFEQVMDFIEEHMDVLFTKLGLWCLILYDNEFCRKFWGTNYVRPIGKVWQYHKRRMILSPDPFTYIRRYL